MEFINERLSCQLIEEDSCVQIRAVAISAGCIKRPYGELCFSEEALQKHAKDLIGKPLLLDHKDEVGSVVGAVSDSAYDPERKAIVVKCTIIKAGNEKLIGLLKLNPSPVRDVSIGAIIKSEEREGKRWATEINFMELSLVLYGADPRAKRFSSCGCFEALSTSQWWDDPELRDKAPRDYFLDPSNRRYPYKTWEGKISCERLRATMSLAGLHGHRQIYERAKALYERHCKEG